MFLEKVSTFRRRALVQDQRRYPPTSIPLTPRSFLVHSGTQKGNEGFFPSLLVSFPSFFDPARWRSPPIATTVCDERERTFLFSLSIYSSARLNSLISEERKRSP